MIVFFASIGISCKRKIPEAHASIEVVRIRYGHTARVVFMTLCLVTNIFASDNMLLGVPATAYSRTIGMHIVGATFLLPVGVTVYIFVGGIEATFLTDYFHTASILIIAYWLFGNLYELLKSAGQRHPISGNYDGRYLTMASKDRILFGILHTCSNFGLVIMDTSYFIKTLSASPNAVDPGYVIGGAFSVALGLENQPNFPTYPPAKCRRRRSVTDLHAAMTIAGKGGAAAVLLMIFMAVPSTLSVQVIAVSSILRIVTCRGIFPMVFTILWRRKSKLAAMAPILGLATGLASDLTTVRHEARHSAATGTIEEGGVHSATVNAQELKGWGGAAAFWAAATFMGHWILWILWPLPMYGSHYMFEKGFYIVWVVIAIIWLWATTIVTTLYPVYRGLHGGQPSTAVGKSEGASANGSMSDGMQGKQGKT
ncbi:hypothetical protein BDW75DRAFT_234973 [Aspergillus navahoensis]